MKERPHVDAPRELPSHPNHLISRLHPWKITDIDSINGRVKSVVIGRNQWPKGTWETSATTLIVAHYGIKRLESQSKYKTKLGYILINRKNWKSRCTRQQVVLCMHRWKQLSELVINPLVDNLYYPWPESIPKIWDTLDNPTGPKFCHTEPQTINYQTEPSNIKPMEIGNADSPEERLPQQWRLMKTNINHCWTKDHITALEYYNYQGAYPHRYGVGCTCT